VTRWGRMRAALDPGQWRTLALMAAVVLGLHVLGFFLLLVVIVPRHLPLGGTGAFAVGTGVTAYTLGLRHAFDADHISAIDNTTRKLMADGKRPMSVGLFFSLGHSTIVFVLAFLFASGVKALGGPVRHGGSTLHNVTNWIGTGVSGTFLYLIAAINVVILWGIVKVFLQMRTGRFDEAALEAKLQQRGLMNRVLGRYNITITGLSVIVALVIGTIELAGLLAQKLNARGGFWTWVEHININTLGFIIVAMFVATWVVALLVWRLAHVEERWSAHLVKPEG